MTLSISHVLSGKYNVEKYFEVLGQLYDQYGPVVKQELGNGIVIHVFDPDDIKTVYINEGTMPNIAPLQESALLYRKLRGLSLGLGNMNGEEWYRLRNSIRQLMLRKQEVSDYLPSVREVANDFVERIKQIRDENGIVRNLADEVGKWSQECVVCFDTRLGSLSGGKGEDRAQEMVEANRVVFQLSAKLKTAISYAEETIEKIDNLAQRNELEEGKYDFLTYLLGRKDLSRKDVIVLTFSLFADGLSTDDEPITAKSIQNLSYLRAVIKETFRLYPNGTEVSRIIPKDLILSGYQVPADVSMRFAEQDLHTHVNLNPLVHFKSEKYFKDPSNFKPERWVRGGDAKDIHPYLLTPFSHGVRTCAVHRHVCRTSNSKKIVIQILLCRK
ncbi:putative cytochrome P450 CYP44 [Blattella germanica]|nr:putative cytochrome P450 CYP44 [Blattella germanica]